MHFKSMCAYVRALAHMLGNTDISTLSHRFLL